MSQITYSTEEEAKELAASRRRAVAQHNASNARAMRSLFKSEAECVLRQQNHTECTRAGIVNQNQIDSHGDALLAQMQPVIEETNLTGAELLELRREMIRQPTSAEESAKRFDTFVEGMRRPIWGTRKVIEAEAKAAKVAAHASPALRRALNVGNAQNSIPLGRALYRRAIDGEPILRKPPK
jgi:hypothetical protein